jgi:tetratricopeptide (TPR) repeat protein
VLWNKANYQAAARQFERVYLKDPQGDLGLQALYRSAVTEYLFIKNYPEALRLFRLYFEANPRGKSSTDALLQVGEIFYSLTHQYEQAIAHYRRLLEDERFKTMRPEFLFRISRSQFFLWRFEDAIQTLELLRRESQELSWQLKAIYHLGMNHLSLAERRVVSPEGESSEEGALDGDGADPMRHYSEALKDFEWVQAQGGSHPLALDAGIGVVTALEGQGKWLEAQERLIEIQKKFSENRVLKIHQLRIQERLTRQSRARKR